MGPISNRRFRILTCFRGGLSSSDGVAGRITTPLALRRFPMSQPVKGVKGVKNQRNAMCTRVVKLDSRAQTQRVVKSCARSHAQDTRLSQAVIPCGSFRRPTSRSYYWFVTNVNIYNRAVLQHSKFYATNTRVLPHPSPSYISRPTQFVSLNSGSISIIHYASQASLAAALRTCGVLADSANIAAFHYTHLAHSRELGHTSLGLMMIFKTYTYS
jgi:hypothetical protein